MWKPKQMIHGISLLTALCVAVASLAAVAAGPEAAEVKEFALIAREVTWEIAPGVEVRAMTYNGTIPGPEIRVREGDRVRIRLRNELNEPTAVHWHGLDVPYDMDGFPGISQTAVLPGEEFTYEFVAKPAGVRFYHSHANEAVQMTNAMHGAFIVESRWSRPTRPDRHYILFLTEWAVNSDSGSAGHAGGHAGAMEFNYYTINGKAFPLTQDLIVREGERVRISLIHVGASYHPMHLHGHQFRVVAADGNEIPESQQLTRNVVPLLPGESYDIEFIADNPGLWALHCHEPHHMMNDMVEPGGLLSLVVYEGYEPLATAAKEGRAAPDRRATPRTGGHGAH